MGGVVNRLPGWESRLDKVISQTPAFKWAENDCCQFAARCVEVMTGVNFAEDFCYSTEFGAARYIRQNGGLTELITRLLGVPVCVNYLQRGDVVELKEDTTVIGICAGFKSVFVTESGLVWHKTADCCQGWVI